jgi:HEPN domain-containing protein
MSVGSVGTHREKTPRDLSTGESSLDQAKLKDMPGEKKSFVFSLMPHYIGTKYPEDVAMLYKQYTKAFVQKLYRNMEEVFKWLRAYLK